MTAPVVTPEWIAAVRSRYDQCFACGLSNPHGLHLDGFAVAGDEVTASFDAAAHHQGFNELLHGGIISAALDEIMAWTAILTEGMLAVTLTLELRFRKPAPPHGRYVAAGRLENRSGSRMRLRGELRRDGEVVAEGAGLFLATISVAELAR